MFILKGEQMSLLMSHRDCIFSIIEFSANSRDSCVGCDIVKGPKKITDIGLKSLSPSISHDSCVSFRPIEARQLDLKQIGLKWNMFQKMCCKNK